MTATATANPRHLSGVELLHDPRWNKGTAFTEAEREGLHLHGLLPPRVFTLKDQESRVMENYRRKTSDLEKYIQMVSLQDRNETLFYRVVIDHVDEMMPIIYTPTVGEACQHFGHILRRTRGLYLSADDRGNLADVMRNWPERTVKVVVVTDGERILGLGDLGTFGMGIPIGKLSLYTALAGIPPEQTLPVTLDVGTNNPDLRNDPLYTGATRERLRGAPYQDLVDEFVDACQEVFPGVLIQFEDFATANAISLLERYRDRYLCFNDDIQGTAAVTLAGLLAGLKITKQQLRDQTLLFFGAGSAATGIADLIVSAMAKSGLDAEQARRQVWFVDSKGLVVDSRTDLAAHKQRYAHRGEFITDLVQAVAAVQPTVLIGVSGQPRTFDKRVVRAMADLNDRPMIFALSNPTKKAECTAEEAYRWSGSRAVYASGSPFPPVTLDGKRFIPGQGNNAYIFPGVGLGVIATQSSRVTDDMFYAAAKALVAQVPAEMLEQGCLYPPLHTIRDVSAHIAVAVAEEAYAAGLANAPPPDDMLAHVKSLMFEPVYASYV